MGKLRDHRATLRAFAVLLAIVIFAALIIWFVPPLLPTRLRTEATWIIGLISTILFVLAAISEVTGVTLTSVLGGRHRRAKITVREIDHDLSTNGQHHGVSAGPLKFIINLDIRNAGPVEGRLTLKVESVIFESGRLTVDPATVSVQLFAGGSILKPFPYKVPPEHSVDNARCDVQLRSTTFPTLADWVHFLEAPGGYILTMQYEVDQLNGKSQVRTFVVKGDMQEVRRHALNHWQTRLLHTNRDQEKLELAKAIEAVA